MRAHLGRVDAEVDVLEAAAVQVGDVQVGAAAPDGDHRVLECTREGAGHR